MRRLLTMTLLIAHCSLLTVCDLWMRPMGDYIRDATNTAKGVRYEISLHFNREDNITSIPVGEETKIRIDLRNPQEYNLDIDFIDRDSETSIMDQLDYEFDSKNQYVIITITNPARLDVFDFDMEITANGRPFETYTSLPKMEARYFDSKLNLNTLSLTGIGSLVSTAIVDSFDSNLAAGVFVYNGTTSIKIDAETEDQYAKLVIGSTQFSNKAVGHTVTVQNEQDVEIKVIADCGIVSIYKLNVSIGEMILASDFTVTNNTEKVYNANPQGVTVSYNNSATEETAGAITVFYKGVSGTNYELSETAPTNAGTYEIYVKTAGGTEYPPITEPTVVGTFTISKFTPTLVTKPEGSAITYGAILNTSTVSDGVINGVAGYALDGSYAWASAANPSSTIPPVSNSGYAVVFTPDDSINYNTLTITDVPVTVNKATPTVTFPTASEITYSPTLTLSSISLSGGSASPTGSFEWENDATVPEANNSGYNVVFTPSDPDNYDYSGVTGWNSATKKVVRSVSLSVLKATPTVTWPVNVRAYVNQTYPDGFQYQSGGSASFAGSNVPGSFSWNTTGFTSSGRHNVTVTFTPTSENYNAVTQSGTPTVRAIPSGAFRGLYEGKGNSVSNARNNLLSKASGITQASGTISGNDNYDFGDLNDGTTRSGYPNPSFVFIGYTVISGIFDEPVTNILGFTGQDRPQTRNVDGITYTRFVEDSNAGAGGDFVSYYYTTDENADNPIYDIFVKIDGNLDESPYPSQSGWTRVAQNANSGTGGSTPNIFIWIRR